MENQFDPQLAAYAANRVYSSPIPGGGDEFQNRIVPACQLLRAIAEGRLIVVEAPTDEPDTDEEGKEKPDPPKKPNPEKGKD